MTLIYLTQVLSISSDHPWDGSTPGISKPAPGELPSCRLQFQPCCNTPVCNYQVALNTLISCFRCVWLGLELKSAGWLLSRSRVGDPCNLHLHLSPAVFDYTDWTWLGKPHTCLYKTLQLTVHVRANENHEVKGTAWRAQRQNCGKAQIWPRLQKNSAALKVPKSTVASIILKWKTFGTTRTLPRAGRPAKLSYRGRRAVVREVKKNPKITVAELQRCIREMGESCRKSAITAALHQSGLYGRVARRKPLLSRHVQRGGRRVLEHLPLFPLMPKVPFCQGNFFFFFFFFL